MHRGTYIFIIKKQLKQKSSQTRLLWVKSDKPTLKTMHTKSTNVMGCEKAKAEVPALRREKKKNKNFALPQEQRDISNLPFISSPIQRASLILSTQKNGKKNHRKRRLNIWFSNRVRHFCRVWSNISVAQCQHLDKLKGQKVWFHLERESKND